MYPDVLREHIQKCKKATDKPFGVNVPLLVPGVEDYMRIIAEEKVPIVFTSAGNPKSWTGELKKRDIKGLSQHRAKAGEAVHVVFFLILSCVYDTVVHVVSSSKFAVKAEEAGCDAVVAEGFEAGGHNGREETTTMVSGTHRLGSQL
jgi:enoyl-[acyl-carrier protein] reductase II